MLVSRRVGSALFAALVCVSSTPSSLFAAPPQEGHVLLARQMNTSNGTSNATTCVSNNGDDISTFNPPLYTENLRPQIHYSPSSEFMNDPNGLIRSGDTWHLYFQYNPNASVAGFQHWGHATSKDLYTWQNHPPAIAPANDTEGIFSGSAVLDVNNTSGFFDNNTSPETRFVAIYTLNTPLEQTQNIAYSSDGQNYTKYENNPVISRNTTQFRDPKVFRDSSTSQWLMTVALPQDFKIAFYGSKDLRQWTELSTFGPAGLLGYQYEVPDLVQVPIQGGERDGQMGWILIISINPGAPFGGSAMQYFMGEWNGTVFTPSDGRVQLMDFGKDFYAGVTWGNAPPGETILTTWASNWQYTNEAPTSPWRGAFTVPRKLTLRWTELNPMHWDYQVAQEPYQTIGDLPQQSLADGPSPQGNETVQLSGDGAFDVRANFSIQGTAAANASYVTARLTVLTTDPAQNLTIGLLVSGGNPITMFVDRRFAGQDFANANPYFTDRFSQTFMPVYRTPNDTTSDVLIDVRIVVDRSLTEVFGQQGRAAASVLTFWDGTGTRPASLAVGTFNGLQLDALSVSAINSTWPACS